MIEGSVSSGCVAPMTCPQPSFSVSTTTNRLIGTPYAYDLNGNMTNDGINTLVYDAENHMTSASSGSGAGAYIYDGGGLRVKRCLPNCSSPTTSTVYLFSGSKVVAEYDNGAAPSSPTREYIYSGTAILAKIEAGATTYYHSDHLSVRFTSDANQNYVAHLGQFPFGEIWYDDRANIKNKFTTYERDSESGNDYAMARYNVNRLGRFSSPDPLAGTMIDPQSLNRYSYVSNDPVNQVDPSGQWCQSTTGTFTFGDDAPVNIDFGSWCDDGFGMGGGMGMNPGSAGGAGVGAQKMLDWLDTTGRLDQVMKIQTSPITISNAQPPPPPGYEQCITEALQEVIHAGETPNDPNNGYGALVHGVVYSAPYPFNIFVGQRNVNLDPSSLSGHPGIQVRWNPNFKTSSAFGRYQITVGTAALYNITDFSPRGQDAGAEAMMQDLNMVVPAMDGNLALAMARGSGTWASLPGANNPGQHAMSMAQAKSVFQNALETLTDCK